MIVSVEKAATYLGTGIDLNELEGNLLALEIAIRKYTNNNFQNRKIRFICDAVNGHLNKSSQYLKEGDTIQISESAYNDGVYTIDSKTDYTLTLNQPLYDETMVLVTKVEYPLDVQRGVLDILRWQYKNANQNYNPDAEKDIQSESISRHSVTYAKDSTESDIDSEFGVPRKYTSFLKRYAKARF